jgi:hypothetical protein
LRRKGDGRKGEEKRENVLLLFFSDSPVSIPPLLLSSIKYYEKNLQNTDNQHINFFIMVL